MSGGARAGAGDHTAAAPSPSRGRVRAAGGPNARPALGGGALACLLALVALSGVHGLAEGGRHALARGVAASARTSPAGLVPAAEGAPSATGDVAVVVEDWGRHPVGAAGVPDGWSKYATVGGRARYDLEITREDGQPALRLRSHDDHTTIARTVEVDLRATPVLEWSWKVSRFPAGADIRNARTSDLTGHVFVVWPRTPSLLRSRLIGYVWDAAIPTGSIERSRKTRVVTFVVMRSGPADVGRWVVERRNVAQDYRRLYGEEPDPPAAVAISIDTNDTGSAAEAFIGRIAFTAARP
jgi:hypothetical protein